MRTSRIRFLSLLAALSLVSLEASRVQAAWPHDPNNGNLPVCTAGSFQQNPVIVSDGAGGVIMAWEDLRGAVTNIYAQRVNAAGVPQWAPDGIPIASTTFQQSLPTITSDGAGGAIIAWEDYRNGNADVYAQRVTAAGVVFWGAIGVPACVAVGNQAKPQIASDGAGGAYVAWEDSRTNAGDIYAQYLNAAGAQQWFITGLAACAVAGTQFNISMISDGAGGAILVWMDNRVAAGDIYATRLGPVGPSYWAPNGVQICTAADNQALPKLATDGVGGAMITWEDRRNGVDYDIYARRVSSTGVAQGAGNGVALCTAATDQLNPTIASDGAGGAIVAWADGRNGAGGDIYVQRISAAMTPQWPANGVAVCTQPGIQVPYAVVPDGAGGAIMVWSDDRFVSGDIFAQRVSGQGGLQWTADGIPICTAINTQQGAVAVADGASGVIVGWMDSRNSIASHIYAQRVEPFGHLGNPEPMSAGVRDVPNDQGGHVRVSWYASYLDPLSTPDLTAYDVYRSAPPQGAAAAIRAGAHRLSSFAEPPAAGERAFVVDPARSQVYAWEYLATINAAHFLSAYSYIAPTTGDSVATSNPRTIFMVVGRNAGSSMYYLAAPDSGYSVDNVAPAPAQQFSAQYFYGSEPARAARIASAPYAWLHWSPSADADFGEYQVYRGSSADFVPGPGNLVVAQADTGYIDLGAAPAYYKLVVVDVHGNPSAAVTTLPSGVVGVAEAPPPGLVWLGPARPNPAVAGAAFRFALPTDGRVTLTLFDEQGRRVRDLVSGYLPAGERTVSWDGRDEQGRLAPSGLYFYRLDALGHQLSRRLALIH